MFQHTSSNQLEQKLERIVETSAMSIYKKTLIQGCVDRFEQMIMMMNLQKVEVEHFELRTYGSLENGFATNDSDADITILTNSYVNERQLLLHIYSEFKRIKCINQYYAQYKQENKFQLVEAIVSSRIPLLKFKEIATGTSIDLTVNNILGVINSKFLSSYSLIDKKIANLGILVKLWAKKQYLIREDRFSSYALMLMVIHFLMELELLPSILTYPSEEDDKIVIKRIKDKVPFSIRPSFLHEEHILQLFNKNIQQQSLLVLFHSFIEFYLPGGDYDDSELMISVTGQQLQSERQLKLHNRYIIVDPFDIHHDPGKRIGKQAGFLDKAFDRAFDILVSNEQKQIVGLFKIIK